MNKIKQKEISDLLNDYSKALTLLEQYDKNELKLFKGKKSKFDLEYQDCLDIIGELKSKLISKKQTKNIFGNEVSHKFESIVKNIYQTFDEKELYTSLEEKAASFLYLAIKDHPFSEGNKRIGSFLFAYFLYKNKGKKISNNTLSVLALLIAESNPQEKNQIIALITQLLK